jgi:hypothetical protein
MPHLRHQAAVTALRPVRSVQGLLRGLDAHEYRYHSEAERRMTECEAELRLHDFSDGSMAYLECDLMLEDHAELNHHDPVYGIWWSPCEGVGCRSSTATCENRQ